MNFEFSDKVKELRARVTAFMDEHVYPHEAEVEEFLAARRRAGWCRPSSRS